MLAFDTEIRDQAYQFFVQETLEFLQVLEEGLLKLRQERSIPLIHTLMRSAHSIKGGSASVGLPTIQHLAHQLETCIRALYQDSVTIDETLESLLLSAFDALQRPLQQQIEAGHHDGEGAALVMEKIYAQIADHLGDAMQSDQDLPSAAELGIDIVLAIFTGDVTSSLTQIETLLQTPNLSNLNEQLQAQANILTGLGELVNLPGFVTIGRTFAQALQINSHQSPSIGQAALTNLRQAQAIVLAGDRVQGGSPSAALTQWLQPPLLTLTSPELQPDLFFSEYAQDFCDDDFCDDSEAIVTEMQWADLEEIADGMAIEVDQSADEIAVDIMSETIAETAASAIDKTIFETSVETAIKTVDETVAQPTGEPMVEIINKTAFETTVKTTVKTTAKTTAKTKSVLDTISQHAIKLEVEKPPTDEPTNSASDQLQKTVRVNLQRLDRMNNLMGEMVTQEHRSQLQTQQLESLLKTLTPRFVALEALSHRLDLWGDRTQIAMATAHPSSSAQAISLHGLDPLQMDSYGDLHSALQTLTEISHQITEGLRDMGLIAQQFQQIQREKHQSLKRVREDLLWARMLPIGDIFQRLPRMVRDLSLQQGKQAQLKLTGTQTLLDKAVLQNLYDPLVHLIRNAIAHGVELPNDRTQQNKNPMATIEVRAYHRGNRTFIEIKDDGRGIDRDRILQRARTLGLLKRHETPTQAQLYNYLFSPGFSTAEQVDDLAGRGVGLDVVQREINHLKGQITIQSAPNLGTQFTLSLPLTLTVAHLLVFRLKKRQWTIALDSLDTIVAAQPSEIITVDQQLYYHHSDKKIPITQHLGVPDLTNGPVTLLLIADHTLAIPVDQVLQEQELAIKPFSPPFTPPSYLYGCTLLGDGSLVPVIDGVALHEYGLQEEVVPLSPAEVESSSPTLMVVDDSATTRHTLTHSLKRAGYTVIQAANGQEALDCLHQSPEIRMVFCDVEMPVMNGYEFLTQCRQKYDRAQLPIVMLTSRGGEKHRQIAQHLGANSYLTKPYLEPEVFNTVRSLVEQ